MRCHVSISIVFPCRMKCRNKSIKCVFMNSDDRYYWIPMGDSCKCLWSIGTLSSGRFVDGPSTPCVLSSSMAQTFVLSPVYVFARDERKCLLFFLYYSTSSRSYHGIDTSIAWMNAHLNFRALLLRIQDLLSDTVWHRMHFLLGDDVSLSGTLRLLEKTFISNRNVHYLIDAFTRIHCLKMLHDVCKVRPSLPSLLNDRFHLLQDIKLRRFVHRQICFQSPFSAN